MLLLAQLPNAKPWGQGVCWNTENNQMILVFKELMEEEAG